MNHRSLLQAFRTATFRRQMTLLVAAGVLTVAGASAWLSSWQGSKQARETLVGQGLSLAASVAQQSQLALLTGGAENAREAIERAFSFPGVQGVELLDSNGREMAARGLRVGAGAAPPRADASAPYLESENESAWSFVAPVRTQGAEASPFQMEDKPTELIGYVRLSQGKQALDQLVARLVLLNFGVGLALALALLLALRQLSRHMTQPLGELASVMGRAGAGEVGLRTHLQGPRDIVLMGEAFNDMMSALEQRDRELQSKNEELARHALTLEERVLERTRSLSQANRELRDTVEALREAQKQLVESEKLASLGRLVAGVAHELNTPLGNALIAASALETDLRALGRMADSGQLRRAVFNEVLARNVEGYQLVNRNVERAAAIVRGFKQLAVDQASEARRRFMLDEVVREMLQSLQPSFRHTPFKLESELEPGIAMDSYPGPLGQVLANVVMNALIHGLQGRERGTVLVQCLRLDAGRVQLVCRDDGAGMSAEVRRRIFEAFFTTRFGQGGSGLGMQIVHTLVTGLLGGRIVVDSEPGEGSSIRVTLPCVAPQAADEIAS